MKKKITVTVIILLIAILIIPIPMRLKDGGTVKYQAVLYSISNVHRLAPTENDVSYEDGIIIEILGIEVFNHVKKAPSAEDPEDGSPPASEQEEEPVLTVYGFEVSYANTPKTNKIYRDTLNPEKLADSSVRHLPIYKLDNLEALEKFKTDFAEEFVMDSGYDEIPSFNEVTKKYTEDFFEGSCLFLVYVDSPNSTHRFALEGINIDEDYFCIHIEETTDAEAVDDVLSGWFITVAVSSESAKDCTEFDVVLNHGFELVIPTVPALREPPELYVVSNDTDIEAMKGTLSWTYSDENRKSVTLNADSSHPLVLKEHMPMLALVPTTYSSVYPLGARLQFGASPNEFTPNTVSVRCWPAKCWGNSQAESEKIPISFENGNIFIALKDGDYIYEVTANWNGTKSTYGSVCYSFYTLKASADAVLEIKKDN